MMDEDTTINNILLVITAEFVDKYNKQQRLGSGCLSYKLNMFID